MTQPYTALGDIEMVETFAEEFFWSVDSAAQALQSAGFALIAVKQFSQLSWSICVEQRNDC